MDTIKKAAQNVIISRWHNVSALSALQSSPLSVITAPQSAPRLLIIDYTFESHAPGVFGRARVSLYVRGGVRFERRRVECEC